ncbi:hypothetical protein [Arthrobacter sp. AQ5-05]|uniref:hypothetical protein n=1 Tax=Arthrobacter sp. AQ5-05 TaxID=2184581 RepID=UPI0012B50CC4|nr:hypothetical protein [Arthrobacter sp. AQ5-05]
MIYMRRDAVSRFGMSVAFRYWRILFRHPSYIGGLFGGTVKITGVPALLRWHGVARAESLTLHQIIEGAGF